MSPRPVLGKFRVSDECLSDSHAPSRLPTILPFGLGPVPFGPLQFVFSALHMLR
jgi:hypothetical protein